MTLTARPRFLIRFAVLAALALCGIVLALSSTGTPPVEAQDGPVPAKPTGVVATATHDSVALAWDDPSDASITHYQIFRRDRDVHDTGEFVEIDSNTGSAATSYTDANVEPERRYVYRVKAVNQHGASTWSDFVRADTPAAPDPADLAPSGLEVSLVENRVTLTWDAPTSDAASVTGYEVLRRRPNDGEAALTTLVADTGNAETGYTDDSANEPGVRYTYRVKALRDGEQSKVSNYDRIDLPEDYAQDTPEPAPEPEEEPSAEALAPSGLTAAVEDSGVALSWTAPAEDAASVTGYEVLRAQGEAELTTPGGGHRQHGHYLFRRNGHRSRRDLRLPGQGPAGRGEEPGLQPGRGVHSGDHTDRARAPGCGAPERSDGGSSGLEPDTQRPQPRRRVPAAVRLLDGAQR